MSSVSVSDDWGTPRPTYITMPVSAASDANRPKQLPLDWLRRASIREVRKMRWHSRAARYPSSGELSRAGCVPPRRLVESRRGRRGILR